MSALIVGSGPRAGKTLRLARGRLYFHTFGLYSSTTQGHTEANLSGWKTSRLKARLKLHSITMVILETYLSL